MQFFCVKSSEGIKYPDWQISLSSESELLFIDKIIIKIIIIAKTIISEILNMIVRGNSIGVVLVS